MKVEKYNVIGDLIESNKKQYIIPVYQRNYEWNKAQCKKLFDDVISSYEYKKKHFLGSIVYVELGEISKLHTYVIIDGQQRITTIYLMLKALLDSCTERDSYAKAEINEILFNVDKYNELQLTAQTKLKLKPIKTDNQQLLLLMGNEYEEMNSMSHIYVNYMYFKELIQKTLCEKDIRIKDVLEGLKQLVSAVIALNDGDDDPQVVFESINSTGLDLSLADLIRNYVLMTEKNQEELFERYWLKIEQNIGITNMNGYIIDYLTFKTRDSVSTRNAYNIYKEFYHFSNFDNQKALEDLYKYSRYYKAFCYGDNKYSKLVNQRLAGLRILDQTTAYPFLFPIFNDFEDGLIQQTDLEKILKLLFGYLLRRIVCGVPSNSLRGLFKNLYSRIFINEENKKHYYDAIVQFFLQITTKDKIPSENEFISALMTTDFYHKKKTCKYILKTLEDINENGDESKEMVQIDSCTIEHIMPQTLNEEWIKELGENAIDIHSKYLHTLGNLTLSAYNSELGARSFVDKKRLLNNVDSHIVILNKYFMNQEYWNEKTIKERAEILSRRINDIFSIDMPTVEIVFNAPDNIKVDFSSDYDVTGTRPMSFVFMGESENVSYYIELLQMLLEKLFVMDSSIMNRLAASCYKIQGASRIYISHDSTKLNRSAEIFDSGIYYETNLSATNIMSFIKNIFDLYSIDDSDFVLFIKRDEISKSKDNCIDENLKKQFRELIATKIIEFLKGYEQIKDIILVTESNTYIRFVSKRIRNITGQVGDGWIKTNDLFAFEINNDLDKVQLNLYIGPTKNNEYRLNWYNYFAEYGNLVKPLGKLNGKWNKLYRKTLAKFNYDNLITEDVTKLIYNNLQEFFENEYDLIVKEFFKNN